MSTNMLLLICWLIVGIVQVFVYCQGNKVSWISYWCAYIALIAMLFEKVWGA